MGYILLISWDTTYNISIEYLQYCINNANYRAYSLTDPVCGIFLTRAFTIRQLVASEWVQTILYLTYSLDGNLFNRAASRATMATRMTARVPATPETHAELKAERDRRESVETFDALLRELLTEAR